MDSIHREECTVTISTHRVESVLKAYSKQTKTENSDRTDSKDPARYNDVVTLSSGEEKKSAFDRISYSLLDIMLKNSPR